MADTALKQQLRCILERHEGRSMAITSQALAKITGQHERLIRLVIRELIKEGLPVASSTEPPAGYFLVAAMKEAEEYADSVKSRLIEDAKRRRDFRHAAAMFLKPAEQGKLF